MQERQLECKAYQVSYAKNTYMIRQVLGTFLLSSWGQIGLSSQFGQLRVAGVSKLAAEGWHCKTMSVFTVLAVKAERLLATDIHHHQIMRMTKFDFVTVNLDQSTSILFNGIFRAFLTEITFSEEFSENVIMLTKIFLYLANNKYFWILNECSSLVIVRIVQ